MMRVGIVSENYDNDSKAFKKLLEKRYPSEQALFIPLLKTIEGEIDRTKKVKRMLLLEAKREKIDFILFFRDLDGLPSEEEKMQEKQQWYNEVKIDESGLFFITIFEIEALILADIQTFNLLYNTNIILKTTPLFQKEPKEFLKQQTFKNKKKYQESHVTDIFQRLVLETIFENHAHQEHPCFQSFILELDEKLNHT